MTGHHAEVNEEYDHLYPGKSEMERGRDISKRCKIAKRIFRSLSTEEQDAVRVEAQADYDEQVATYKKLQETLTAVRPQTLESQLR